MTLKGCDARIDGLALPDRWNFGRYHTVVYHLSTLLNKNFTGTTRIRLHLSTLINNFAGTTRIRVQPLNFDKQLIRTVA
jgi:hypothetical protein